MPKPENIVKHKFKPGQSGNKKGRPKGVRNFRTILEKALATRLKRVNPVTETEEELPLDEHLVFALIAEGLYGDRVKAINSIMDRLDGKVAQKTEISTSEDNTPTIRIIGGLPD
jgi:hypothetical protein